MQHPTVETHPPATAKLEGSERGHDEATVPVFLTRREAFALAWILARFLGQVPGPLTPMQERLGGLVAFLRDHLDPPANQPISADEGSRQHTSAR